MSADRCYLGVDETWLGKDVVWIVGDALFNFYVQEM